MRKIKFFKNLFVFGLVCVAFLLLPNDSRAASCADIVRNNPDDYPCSPCDPVKNMCAHVVDSKELADGRNEIKFAVYLNPIVPGFDPGDNKIAFRASVGSNISDCRGFPYASSSYGTVSTITCDFRPLGNNNAVLVARWNESILKGEVNILTNGETDIHVGGTSTGDRMHFEHDRQEDLGGGKHSFIAKNRDGSDFNWVGTTYRVRVMKGLLVGNTTPEEYPGSDADWPGEYDCNSFLHKPINGVICSLGCRVTCNLDNFEWGELHLLKDGEPYPGTTVDTAFFTNGGVPGGSVKFLATKLPGAGLSFANPDPPYNDFLIDVEAEGSFTEGSYTIQLVDSLRINASAPCAVGYSIEVEGLYAYYCDYSKVDSTQSYWIELIGPSGNLHDKVPLNFQSIPAGFTGDCTCHSVVCHTPGPGRNDLVTDSNLCIFGQIPEKTCTKSPTNSDPISDPSDPHPCACTCVDDGTSSVPPLPSLTLDDLAGWLDAIHKYLIAIGVVAATFILPYIGLQLATGTPESIKGAIEWFWALFWGLLLLFLSGTIIKIAGTDMLKF